MSHYHIKTLSQYNQATKEAKEDPATFWGDIARDNFLWRKPWDTLVEFDFTRPKVTWFDGAQVNISENCLDRNLATRGDKTALIFEPNDPKAAAEHITYSQLYERVCKMANVLKAKGIKKEIAYVYIYL